MPPGKTAEPCLPGCYNKKKCRSPEGAKQYRVGSESTSGGQDWTSLEGKILCEKCHDIYKRNGTFEEEHHDDHPEESAPEVTQCFSMHCDAVAGCELIKITQDTKAGGQDWRWLVGWSLCRPCYNRFRNSGCLEQTKKKAGVQKEAMRCTYRKCPRRNDGNDKTFQQFMRIPLSPAMIEEVDWSSYAGRVLCLECISHYREQGTFERERRCSYTHCITEAGNKLYKIGSGTRAGVEDKGRDWSSLFGKMLCKPCYLRFRNFGSLEKAEVAGPRRCTYSHCPNPENSTHFHAIKERFKSQPHQDWTPLTGQTLCNACFSQYRKRGTLERTKRKRAADAPLQQCTNEQCKRSESGKAKFTKIDEGTTAGGQFWDQLQGSVLCKQCFDRYRQTGSLERAPPSKKIPVNDTRKCFYENCYNPDNSENYYVVKRGKESGGQDWSPLVGKVLCKVCHHRYKRKGTLEREMQSRKRGTMQNERQCTHCHTKRSPKNIFITEATRAGQRDWSSLAGRFLCLKCYNIFMRKGTLEATKARDGRRLHKVPERCTNRMASLRKRQEGKEMFDSDESEFDTDEETGSDWSKSSEMDVDEGGERGEDGGGDGWGEMEIAEGSMEGGGGMEGGDGGGGIDGMEEETTDERLLRIATEEEEAKEEAEMAMKLAAEAVSEMNNKRCTLKNCLWPEGKKYPSMKFYKIAEAEEDLMRLSKHFKPCEVFADWTSMVGEEVCARCYNSYKRNRTLKLKRPCGANRPFAKPKVAANEMPDAVEKNEDEEKDEDDCLICFDQPRTVCMVPCGHLLLCDACVAEKILGQRRLFECPLCRAELQFPFVMQREEWASLGHPVYE